MSDDIISEAAIPAARLVYDGRDHSVYEFAIRSGTPTFVRIPILWGPGRNRRALTLLAGLFLRSPGSLPKVAGLFEHADRIDWWCNDPLNVADVTRHLVRVNVDAFAFKDRWVISQPQFVTLRPDGILDWERLAEGHPLHTIAKAFHLGVHKKGGASRGGAL